MSREENQAAIVAAQRRFEADFREWRSSRPEFAAVIEGVKNEITAEQLSLLSVAAGLDGNDLSGLRSARVRALGMRDLAAHHEDASAEFVRLEKEFLDLEKQLDGAKTHGEAERLEGEIAARSDALGVARRRVTETQTAAEIVEGAKIAGLV